ncbi:Radial spoke head protein 6 A [Intoshia linei]|uniref:Radial spoke head protein 6 A n=1 Tax=Intoshia linei TaxID=1819745 RepID=A0A177BB48_9BILA|nr:Radial spoke head protein 6 A [Intoshia linei]
MSIKEEVEVLSPTEDTEVKNVENIKNVDEKEITKVQDPPEEDVVSDDIEPNKEDLQQENPETSELLKENGNKDKTVSQDKKENDQVEKAPLEGEMGMDAIEDEGEEEKDKEEYNEENVYTGVDIKPEDDIDQEDEEEFLRAKAYLMKCSVDSDLSLYDHLVNVITRTLDEQPDDVVDIFEDISREEKKFRMKIDSKLTPIETVPESIEKAEKQIELYKINTEDIIDSAVNEETEQLLPNLQENFYYFKQAGVGFNSNEVMQIWLAIKKLVELHPIINVRFWGKILGTVNNYIIVEAEYREGEEEEEEEDENAKNQNANNLEAEVNDETAEENEEANEFDQLPKSDYKPPVDVPREDPRSGVNKKIYYVCNNPGETWTRLPYVTPIQINISRQIRSFFSGNLNSKINSYPPFPGNESNYLRSQIARISAGTQISPLGYYQFDDEEEEELEESDGRDTFMVNVDFEPMPIRELCDVSLANWVHHVQHILPQGRCTWWNPVQKQPDAFEEDEEELEEESEDAPVPETGPPLLNPLSEDAEIKFISPWSTSLSSGLIPQYSIAVIRSNLWPGAVAYAVEKKFENIYVGWGLKYLGENFDPVLLPMLMTEYPSGPEITEADDPTPEEEASLRAAQQEAADIAAEMEEEGEEEDEEED